VNSIRSGLNTVRLSPFQPFSDGAKAGFVSSALSYLNSGLKNEMIEQSRIDSRNGGSGLSLGVFGDGFKLAGGRWDDNINGQVQCSLLRCLQSGPGSVFNVGYSSGGFVDMITESFAGPYDKANSYWFYNAKGLILQDSSNMFIELANNYTTSLFFFGSVSCGTYL
jgi:hypothetical protein